EISKKMKRSCLLIKAAAGAALITIIEFVFGLIFNIILKKNVWDYSDIPFNFKGQICLLYSIFWLILCLIFIPFAGKINKKLENS
ncbi:MAG: hypothetical protein J6D52_01940, partial [Clostridia bacterium]|nr:hypothetical protein [Clostridia bacterium]